MINIPSFDELYDLAPQEIKDYVDKCEDTPQGTDWHPEGNVNIHLRIVYDRARAFGDINLALAAFLHDLGKVDTTAPNKRGGWSAHGHEKFSSKIAKRNSDWIREMGGNPEEVIEIVYQHMRIQQLANMRPSKQAALKANPYFRKISQFTKFDDMKTLTKDENNRYK